MKTTLTIVTLILGLGTAITVAAAEEAADAHAGHNHTTPAAKAGPRMEQTSSVDLSGAPPEVQHMQSLNQTIRMKEQLVTRQDPTISADLRKLSDEFTRKKREMMLKKDPSLKELYEEFDALKSKMRLPLGMQPVGMPATVPVVPRPDTAK